jgi:hypothetical protein
MKAGNSVRSLGGGAVIFAALLIFAAHLISSAQAAPEKGANTVRPPALQNLLLRWAAVITGGPTYNPVEQKVMPMTTCLLRLAKAKPGSSAGGPIIQLVFPLPKGGSIAGKELNDLCSSASLEMVPPSGNPQAVTGIPKPAKKEPTYRSGSLALGVGSVLAVKDHPLNPPNVSNLDVLLFSGLQGHGGVDSEIIIDIPVKSVFKLSGPGKYYFTWLSGQLRSNKLEVEVLK